MQIGGEGGAEEPALRPLWRGRMGMNKQQQLDLFAGLAEGSDGDSSDIDDNGPAMPDRILAAGQAQQPISFQYNMQSEAQDSCSEQSLSGHNCSCDEVLAAPEDTQPDSEPESSSSDEESSSSSSSDDSSDSDGDPDLPPPVQVQPKSST